MATVREGNKTVLVIVDVLANLNVAMMWLRYPGRVNRVVKAAALEFGAPQATG